MCMALNIPDCPTQDVRGDRERFSIGNEGESTAVLDANAQVRPVLDMRLWDAALDATVALAGSSANASSSANATSVDAAASSVCASSVSTFASRSSMDMQHTDCHELMTDEPTWQDILSDSVIADELLTASTDDKPCSAKISAPHHAYSADASTYSTATSEAYCATWKARINQEVEHRTRALMRAFVSQAVQQSGQLAMCNNEQVEPSIVEEFQREIKQLFQAQFAEQVKEQLEREQVNLALNALVSHVELEAELRAVTATLSEEILECESQVEAVRELIPLKNFLEVGQKLGQHKAEIKRLSIQLLKEQEMHCKQLKVVREQAATANERLQMLAIGTRSLHRSEQVLAAMRTKDASRRIILENQLKAQEMPLAADRAKAAGLTVQQFRRLLRHLETVLYGSGAGDIYRTKLLMAALLERPAVQRLLGTSAPQTAKIQETAHAMLVSARATLQGLATRGTFKAADRLHFEAIVTALTPHNAREQHMVSLIMNLLGISQRQLSRARQRKAKLIQGGNATESFSHVMAESIKRKQRKDFNEEGRKLCRTFWHSHTRFDTNSRKKRRHRIGVGSYIEHWRHIQYDTNEEMWEVFRSSAEYGAYLLLGGAPISRSLFFEMKCWCISKADHEECACPLCTQMFELVRDWHRQRSAWYRDADKRLAENADSVGECACGDCAPDSAYRDASKSVQALNDFLLCPKISFPSLRIPEGPRACAEVKLRRRQCCRVPLLSDHADPGMATADYQDCDDCGFDRRMPTCPIEHTSEPASYKVYAPRGDSNQEALVIVNGTRAQLMAQLKKVYAQWLPHHWLKCWCEHQRHLTYSTFGADEACISTDFSAVYDHKAFASKCCEQPHHSNMAVFVLTYCRMQEGKRHVYTEVVRVISEAKGGTHFHNVALKQVTTYIRSILPDLKRIYIFTDGCKGQYKGRKNFARIAEFPSQHDGVQLIHRFTSSHHFKGPHDQYGKDAKVLTRTAEKNKKRRLPGTHDWYDFLATEMAAPLKKWRSMRQIVDEMQASERAVAAAREEEVRLLALASKRVAVRLRLNVGVSGVHVALHVPSSAARRVPHGLAQQAQGLARRKARMQRTMRKRKIVELGEGDEVMAANGKQRIENSSGSVTGIFSAHKYHWLFYGKAGSGLRDGVAFGTKCTPSECHAIVDDALEGDADPVPNSDSMYEFAGVNPAVSVGEIFHKCVPCHCIVCRSQPAPSAEFVGCPNRSQTGLWRRSACHRSYGAVQRALKVRQEEKAFGSQIDVNELLAAAADPNWIGRGGRPYWLLRTRSKAYITRTGYKSAIRGVPGIRKGTLIVKAQWYDATDSTGRRYRLLPAEIVHVAVSSIIQERFLEFMRGGSEVGDSIFSDEHHARIMSHNLENYC